METVHGTFTVEGRGGVRYAVPGHGTDRRAGDHDVVVAVESNAGSARDAQQCSSGEIGVLRLIATV